MKNENTDIERSCVIVLDNVRFSGRLTLSDLALLEGSIARYKKALLEVEPGKLDIYGEPEGCYSWGSPV